MKRGKDRRNPIKLTISEVAADQEGEPFARVASTQDTPRMSTSGPGHPCWGSGRERSRWKDARGPRRAGSVNMHHKDQRESAANCWLIRSIASEMTKLGCFMQFKHLCRKPPHAAFYWQLRINGNFWSFSTYINLLTPWTPLGHFKSSKIIRGGGAKLSSSWRRPVERFGCASDCQQRGPGRPVCVSSERMIQFVSRSWPLRIWVEKGKERATFHWKY